MVEGSCFRCAFFHFRVFWGKNGDSPFFGWEEINVWYHICPETSWCCFFSVTLQGFVLTLSIRKGIDDLPYCEPGLRQEPNSIVNANAHISDIQMKSKKQYT